MTNKPAAFFFVLLGLSGCDAALPAMNTASFADASLKNNLQAPLLPVFCQYIGQRDPRAGSYRIRSLNARTLEVVTLVPGRPVSARTLDVTAVSADLIAANSEVFRSESTGIAQALMMEARETEGRRSANLFVSFKPDDTAEATTVIFPLECLDGA